MTDLWMFTALAIIAVYLLGQELGVLKIRKEMYSKTCVKWPLKIDKTKILMTNGSLMKVESIAECSNREHSAIFLTCIKR